LEEIETLATDSCGRWEHNVFGLLHGHRLRCLHWSDVQVIPFNSWFSGAFDILPKYQQSSDLTKDERRACSELFLFFELNTFCRHLQLATLGDFDRLLGLVSPAFWHILNLLYNFIAFENFTEDNVLPVKMAKIEMSATVEDEG
jgi:hypothetical protein